MDAQSASRLIAHLADAQHGVVARRQLTARGIGRGALEARLQDGRLLPLHRGVYAVGHRRLSQRGVWLAATLAAGPGTALSHRDAGALHGIWSGRRERRVEVTSPHRLRATDRLRVYERRVLPSAQVVIVHAIPVTTVARTLLDLAEVVSREHLASAFAEADRRGVLDVGAVEAAQARAVGRRGHGHAALSAALAEHARRGAQLTRSELEIHLRRIVRQHALPQPQLNVCVDRDEVDALWEAERVAVEADGWEFHRDRAAFARDRAKANRLTLKGYRVLRFTHDDIVRRSVRVAVEIRRALGQPPGRASPSTRNVSSWE